MSYTAIVIDDEQICIDNLQNSLAVIPEIELLSTSTEPKSGMKLLLEHHPDLLFLDVEMPQMTGFDLLKSVQDKIDWPLHVVFYTAYDKYLLDALRSSAFDYLLKPYQPEELETVIDRFLAHTAQEHSQSDVQTNLSRILSFTDSFMIDTVTGSQLLKIDQIGYFEHQPHEKCWSVSLISDTSYLLRKATRAEDILGFSNNFFQINQYQIINLDYLSAINDKECLLLPPFDRRYSFKISRKFYKELQQKMNFL
jgi:two-component system, LytTR family, response regulator